MSDSDGIIRIGTEVDISGIRAGMAEAAATVKASTSQMEGAYKQLAQATVDYAAKTAVLRDGIKQLVTGAIPYAESQKVLVPILKEQAAASDALKTAKVALASIENAETEAVRANISSRMAATAELRVFEGNMMGSTRAAGAFLNLLPGMGAAMQAAFPVFGALALGGVLIDITEKIVKFSNEAAELGRELGSGWMDGAIAQLSGFGKEIKQVDDEILKLAHDNDEVRNRMQQDAVENVRLTQGDAAGTWLKGGQLQQQIDALEKLKQAHAAAAEAIDKQINSEDEVSRVGSIGIEKMRKEQEEAVAQYNSALKEQMELIQRKNNLYLEAQQEQKRQDQAAQKRGTRDDNSAARQQLQEIETELDNLNVKRAELTGHALTAADGAAFWAQYLTAFKSGSEEAKHVLDEYSRDQAKATDEIHQQIQKFQQEQKNLVSSDAVMSQSPTAPKWLQEQAEDVLHAGERWKEFNDLVAKGSEIQDQVKEQFDIATVNAREAAGSISKLQALQQTAAIHAAEYAAKLKVLNDELDRLKKEAADNTANGVSNAKNAAQQQQVKNQITQVQGQGQATGISDQAAITQQIAQPYLNAFNQIDQSWLQVQNRMMFTTRNLSLEFAKMGQSILISIVDSLEKSALVAAEKEAVMVIAHSVANQQKLASDATTAAASEGISSASLAKKLALEIIGLFHHTATNTAKTASDTTSAAAGAAAAIPANITMAESYAAVAAVAAMASAAAIPIIGWAMAPGVGAGMYATGQGFAAMASLDTGTGYVPRDGMAYLHEGEAVVPAPTVNELRGSDGGGDVTIHQSNNWNTMDDKQFQRQLYKHAQHVAGAVQKHMRQGGHG